MPSLITQAEKDEFPSLQTEHKPPFGWIQWKGTDICCDIHCECGASSHFDGEFMYHIKCPDCGRVYECDGHIQLHPLDFEPDDTKLAESSKIGRWNDWKHWDVIGDMKKALDPEIDPKTGLPKEDAARMVRLGEVLDGKGH